MSLSDKIAFAFDGMLVALLLVSICQNIWRKP